MPTLYKADTFISVSNILKGAILEGVLLSYPYPSPLHYTFIYEHIVFSAEPQYAYNMLKV